MLRSLLEYTPDLPVATDAHCTDRAPSATAFILRRGSTKGDPTMPARGSSRRAAEPAPLQPLSQPRSNDGRKKEGTVGDNLAVRIVGVGASAGGLDAFIELISAIP